jgi:hypothetical protein
MTYYINKLVQEDTTYSYTVHYLTDAVNKTTICIITLHTSIKLSNNLGIQIRTPFVLLKDNNNNFIIYKLNN